MQLIYALLLAFCIDGVQLQSDSSCAWIQPYNKVEEGIEIVLSPETLDYSNYRYWSFEVGQRARSGEPREEICLQLEECQYIRRLREYHHIMYLNGHNLRNWRTYLCDYTLLTQDFEITMSASWSSITLQHRCKRGAQACITNRHGTMLDGGRLEFDYTRNWAYHMTCSKRCDDGITEPGSSMKPSTRTTQSAQQTTSTSAWLVTNEPIAVSTIITGETSASTSQVTSPLSSSTKGAIVNSTGRGSFSEEMRMSTPGNQSRQLTQPAVVGISVAAVVFIGFIIALLVILLLRRRALCSKPAKKPDSPAQVLNGPSNAVISAEYSVVLKHDEDSATYRATPGAMYQHPGTSTSRIADPAEDDEYYQGDFEFHGPGADADNRSELSYELARAIPNSNSHARDSNADNMYGNLDECGEGIPANIREGTDPEPDADYNCLEENTEDTTYYNV